MNAPMRGFFIVFLAVFLAAGDASAQWKKIAANLITTYPNTGYKNHEYGAIHFKDGMLWAGWKDLQFSSDLGKTWQQSTINIGGDIITDINFYDRLNGLVATLNSGVFL